MPVHQLLSALKKENFQTTIDGKKTAIFFLEDGNVQAAITNYGARLVALSTPDKDGNSTDVVVGYDNIDDYIADKDYHGAIVGRYANRIARGKFPLKEKQYSLAINNPPNHLHGGWKGFNSVVWEVKESAKNKLILSHTSVDGDEGYPGRLHIMVEYELLQNKLHIRFEATTDATTVVNLCNHAYFNLNGQGSGSILNHLLEINADLYTPIDETSIPYGILAPVNDTPFDFRHPIQIGARINEPDEQLENGTGYDHNFVLNKTASHLSLAAKATGDKSCITLEIFTTEPGIQFYSGNFLEGLHTIKYGLKDELRSAFCLETQHFPDSPNQPGFPSTVLEPGEIFRSETVFQVGIQTMDHRP